MTNLSSELRVQFVSAPRAIRLRGGADHPGGRRRASGSGDDAKPREEGCAVAAVPRPTEGAVDGEKAPPPGSTTPGTPAAAAVTGLDGRGETPPAWVLDADRLDRVLTVIESEARAIPDRVGEALAAVEPELVRLALAAASAVLRRRFDDGADEMTRLVRDAIQRIIVGIDKPDVVQVAVHPDELDAIAAGAADAAREGVAFLAEPTQAPGTVSVRSGLRRIGIDITREIDRLTDRILGDGSDAGSDAEPEESTSDAPRKSTNGGGDEHDAS